MFRRIRNAANQANPLGPLQLQTMNQANQLIAAGKPGQAAQLFASLAAEMEATSHPRRAANLHAQAAHAFADSQDGPSALVQARAALHLFIQNQMVGRTPVFYANITRKMANHGMKNALAALTGEFAAQVGQMPAPVAPAKIQGHLPTNCPKCGAPIHADEANWVDPNTVECEFCGSMIRPE
jgi:hypothetical protein